LDDGICALKGAALVQVYDGPGRFVGRKRRKQLPGGHALERGKVQHRAPVHGQQHVDGPVAEAAFAVEENDGEANVGAGPRLAFHLASGPCARSSGEDWPLDEIVRGALPRQSMGVETRRDESRRTRWLGSRRSPDASSVSMKPPAATRTIVAPDEMSR